MSALWMVYAAAVAMALGVAARAAEAALRSSGRPGRWPWLAALAGSWALPLHALLRPSARAETAPALPVEALSSSGAGVVGSAEGTAARAAPEVLGERVLDAMTGLLARLPGAEWAGAEWARKEPLLAGLAETVEGWAGPLWLGSSIAAALLVAGAVALLARRSRRWPEVRVLDEAVRVSPSFGPAVVGIVRPRIVLPRWVLRMGEGPLRLVLAHESEHRRARDTLVLALGGLAAVAAPWNLPLWWQLRRLRLAVELDCDERVIRRGAPPRAYGALLVEIGERVGRVGLPAAALAERTSFLERRLRMITETRGRRFGWTSAWAVALAVGMVAVACETPPPTVPAPTGPAEEEVAREPGAETQGEEAPSTLTAREVETEPGDVVAVSPGTTGGGAFQVQAVELPSEALIVVDGVIIDDKGVADIQAMDVARIEVVKGEAARSLYGERARDGVIHVTTTGASVAEGDSATFQLREEPVGRVRAREIGEPLVIVDGVITARTLRGVDELDVASVEVVKGPAAAALYGSRAKNGVVVVTTKEGNSVAATGRVELSRDERRAGTIRAVEGERPEPLLFVDGELWRGSAEEITELGIARVEVLMGAAADAFLAGTGIERGDRPVVRVTTKR